MTTESSSNFRFLCFPPFSMFSLGFLWQTRSDDYGEFIKLEDFESLKAATLEAQEAAVRKDGDVARTLDVIGKKMNIFILNIKNIFRFSIRFAFLIFIFSEKI